MNIIITGPTLDANKNVSGISSVVSFIIENNPIHHYIHFEIGKKDNQKRDLKWLINIIVSYFKWFYLLLVTKNKIVHFNLPLDKRAVIRDCPMLILTKLLKVKMILHVHGGSYVDNDEIPAFANFLIKHSFSGNNPKIVLGESEKQFLETTFNCKNIIVLPNTISLDDAAEFVRTESDEHTCLDILYLGRIRGDKGVGFILSAFKILEEVYDLNYKFHLAGKGRDETLFIPKFKEVLKDKFVFHGVVSGEAKYDLLKKCNTFLLPSYFEGLPIALLEALAYGLVPIVTDVGSIKYVVKDKKNGLIVNKKSATDIVDAIITLSYDHALVNTLSKNAKQTMFNDFSPDAYIKKLNQIYSYE